MHNQSLISRFRPGFIPSLPLLVCLLFLICIGPGISQGLAAQVTLAWDANTDPAVAGYKLYYGTASRTYGTPAAVGKVTQYTLTGIEEGKNAYFAVTAYDTSGNESAFSTELECFTLVPSPAVNGVITPATALVVSTGTSQTFTITPAANYAIADVLVNGVSVGAVTSYTLSNISANYNISARFAAIQTATNAVTLWRNSATGENVIWYMAGANGSTLSSYAYLPTVSDPAWSIAGSADFDADGNPDILWRNTATGMNAIWYLTSANGLTVSGSACLPTVTDPAWTIANIADFDSDGKPDILWRNTATGDNAVWYMTGADGSTVSSYEYLPTVADTAWDIAGTADFNSDGIPDILWRNTSGDNAIWHMTGENGSTLSSYEYLPPVADTDWNIVGTTDLDEDGKPDVMWRNTATGDNVVWYMTGENGSTISSYEYLPAVTDQNWTIVGLN